MRNKILRAIAVATTVSILSVSSVLAAPGSVVEPQGTIGADLKKGDTDNNGKVEVTDALEVLKVITGIYTEQNFQVRAGDISGDGKLGARDALLILQNSAKLRDDDLGYEDKVSDIKYEIPEVYKEGSSFLSEKAVGFYGADGFGRYTTGGRGGKVIEVTNLNDSGEGSLRSALAQKGARIIVFKVSGVIYLKSGLRISDNVTVAGETAPGDGITLANYGVGVSGSNVIVRYLTIRPGDQAAAEQDGVDICAAKNVIMDHCSVSFACDETLSARPSGSGDTYDAVSDKVSVQWCMIAESITDSVNIGKRHGMGSLIRGAQGAKITYHHNMYTSHSSRVPMVGNYMASTLDNGNFSHEFINNICYNWRGDASSKCADADENGVDIHISNLNFINNYYKQGPESTGTTLFSEGSIGNHMYIAGNRMNGELTEDQKSLVGFTNDVLATNDNPYYVKSGLVMDVEKYFLAERFSYTEMKNMQTAEDAARDVLAYVGNSRSRDCLDEALIDGFNKGEGKLINQTFEAKGWYKGTPSSNTGTEYFNWIQGKYPEYASYPAYTDTDKDGMSDAWEDAVGLDKNNESDGSAKYLNTEYTNLDVFLQFLVENPEAAIGR